MRLLSNEILIESYYKALHLKLEPDFILMLLSEIKKRKLNLQ